MSITESKIYTCRPKETVTLEGKDFYGTHLYEVTFRVAETAEVVAVVTGPGKVATLVLRRFLDKFFLM